MHVYMCISPCIHLNEVFLYVLYVSQLIIMMGVALATAFMLQCIVIYLTLRDVYISVYVNCQNCHMAV